MNDPIRWRDPAGGAPAGARELLLRARDSRAMTAARRTRSAARLEDPAPPVVRWTLAVPPWVNHATNVVLAGVVVAGCVFAVLVPPMKQDEPAPRWLDTPPSRAIRLDDNPPWREEEPCSDPPRSAAPTATSGVAKVAAITSRPARLPRAALP